MRSLSHCVQSAPRRILGMIAQRARQAVSRQRTWPRPGSGSNPRNDPRESRPESPLKTACTMINEALRESPANSDDEASSFITAALTTGLATQKVADLCARWHLAHQQPDRAVACIDRAVLTRSSSGRFLLDTAHCLNGCRAAAHMDFSAWSADDACPVHARRLLALMEAEEGRRDLALAAFRRNVDLIDDACSIKGLLLMSAEAGMPELADQWAQRLVQTPCAWLSNDHLNSILEQFGYRHRPTEFGAPPAPLVHRLSIELLGDEDLIPSLVAAAEAEPDMPTCRLLERALETALPNLENQTQALEALARLAMLSGNHRQAHAWIVKGLTAEPLSVPLALLLAESLPADVDTDPDTTFAAEADKRDAVIEAIPTIGHIRSDHADETTARVATQVEDKSRVAAPSALRDDTDPVMADMDMDPVEVINTVAEAHPDWPDVQRVARLLKAA